MSFIVRTAETSATDVGPAHGPSARWLKGQPPQMPRPPSSRKCLACSSASAHLLLDDRTQPSTAQTVPPSQSTAQTGERTTEASSFRCKDTPPIRQFDCHHPVRGGTRFCSASAAAASVTSATGASFVCFFCVTRNSTRQRNRMPIAIHAGARQPRPLHLQLYSLARCTSARP